MTYPDVIGQPKLFRILWYNEGQSATHLVRVDCMLLYVPCDVATVGLSRTGRSEPLSWGEEMTDNEDE